MRRLHRRVGDRVGHHEKRRRLVKALSFELGGKNAAVVFADADFEAAVSGTMRSVFSNCGQVCLCSERACTSSARSSSASWRRCAAGARR